MKSWYMTLLAALSLGCAPVAAQEMKEFIQKTTASLSPVSIKAEVSELGVFSSISNGVFQPKGQGPFPAVVLGHTCGGVSRPHIRKRMQELLDAGYVVLALDSFGPRNISDCRSQSKILATATVMDEYGALDHLSKLPVVDSTRIYFSGYSWGGWVAPLLASPQSAEALGSKLRYRAVVSNYGFCVSQRNANSPRYYPLQKDIDRPLLVLMAGEDKEGKPSDCLPLLQEIKAGGKPVEWHLYENTYHAWDQEDIGMYSVTTGWGETNLYRYSKDATVDSTKRILDFFSANR
ncbi:dienelactone hydrolase family protein [Noviherbaspirillum sedimenti]|uniref:Dienelactone hydrolase domain-containing protein n=1 Tax=Noviherbaspirillum sedimenti TaxID=2320865 RepID=A0A3A3G733_9BURK|nr:dienelactone hydrolase family protein [Noviherbaspirillum sedimenti]RJG03455.1 hypothetical protein D3878_19180 [Noviherbaspirillum sedimenti]